MLIHNLAKKLKTKTPEQGSTKRKTKQIWKTANYNSKPKKNKSIKVLIIMKFNCIRGKTEIPKRMIQLNCMLSVFVFV